MLLSSSPLLNCYRNDVSVFHSEDNYLIIFISLTVLPCPLTFCYEHVQSASQTAFLSEMTLLITVYLDTKQMFSVSAYL